MNPNETPVPPEASNSSVPPPSPQGKSNNTGMAVLAYLGILIIIPFLTDAKNDPFVKFHLKQGLILLICEFAAWFLYMIPVLGWMLAPIVQLTTIVFIILGIVNVVGGKTKELPIVGSYANSFNL